MSRISATLLVVPNVRPGNLRAPVRIPYLRAVAVLTNWDGETEQAMIHLQQAVQLTEEIGLPGGLWRILANLGELYQSHKNGTGAQQAFACAAHIVQSLANRMEDEQQRTTFLSAPQVRAAFAHVATSRRGNDTMNVQT